jgi:hypothetical protein
VLAQIEVLQVGSGGPNSTLQDAEDLFVAACLCRTTGHPGGCLQVQHSSSARRGRFLHSLIPFYIPWNNRSARKGQNYIYHIPFIISAKRRYRFFAFFHLLQHSSAKRSVFKYIFRLFYFSPRRRGQVGFYICFAIYTVQHLSPREGWLSFFRPCGMERIALKCSQYRTI